jgi:hypothetical protein
MDLLRQDTYKTSLTPLAVWLYISGIKKPICNKSQKPYLWIFDQPKDSTISNLISQWENGIAVGNVSAFFKTYKSFLKEMKDEV